MRYHYARRDHFTTKKETLFDLLDRYALVARAQPVSPTTVNTYVKRIHTFWAWLTREKVIKENPLAAVRPPRVGRKRPRFFEAEIIKKVLAQLVDKPRELALILLMLDTGITLQEVVDLADKDMDLAKGTTRVYREKTKEDRSLFFCPAVAAACAAYRAVRPPPVTDARFFLTWDGRPLSKNRVKQIVARIGARAGLEERLSPHKLRHTFATMSLRNGSNLEYVRIMMGHHDVTTTSRNYLHMTDADVAHAAKTTSPVANLGFSKASAGMSRSRKARSDLPDAVDEAPTGEKTGNTYVLIQNQAPQKGRLVTGSGNTTMPWLRWPKPSMTSSDSSSAIRRGSPSACSNHRILRGSLFSNRCRKIAGPWHHS